jgi:hypothetical protein
VEADRAHADAASMTMGTRSQGHKCDKPRKSTHEKMREWLFGVVGVGGSIAGGDYHGRTPAERKLLP